MQQYEARIRLKSDTEARWNTIANSFKPLAGEMIIYSADGSHPYCRVKIGDGDTTLANLPFIDSGTINGKATEVVKLATFDDRPLSGSPDKLYVDMSTNRIYHYDNTNGYTQLSNFSLNVVTDSATLITSWNAGAMTEAQIENHVLKIVNGQIPALSSYRKQVVSDVSTAGGQQG